MPLSSQKAAGSVSAALLHNNFTVKGKEEFSDVIKKLLREKFPGVPLVAWGKRLLLILIFTIKLLKEFATQQGT